MELVNALSAATPCPVRCFIGGRITRLKIFLTRVSARGVKERLDLRFCVNGEEELTIDELRQTSRILRDDAKHTTLMYLSTGIELDRMSKRVNPQWVDLRGLLALTPNSLLRGTCTVYALATEPMPPSLAPRASDASRTPRLSGASRTEDASDTDCLGVAIEFGARLLASVQYCPGGEQRLPLSDTKVVRLLHQDPPRSAFLIGDRARVVSTHDKRTREGAATDVGTTSGYRNALSNQSRWLCRVEQRDVVHASR